MLENCHRVHFLTHYLNTSVFGSLTQAQFSTLIPRVISNSHSLAVTVIFSLAAVIPCRLKIDREQIHTDLGG